MLDKNFFIFNVGSWGKDGYQFNRSDCRDGANSMPLNETRKTYRERKNVLA